MVIILDSFNFDTNTRDLILIISESTPLVNETTTRITLEQNALSIMGSGVNFTGINNMISKGDIISFNLVDKGIEPMSYYYGNYLVDYSNATQLNLVDSYLTYNIYAFDSLSGEPSINKEIYKCIDYDKTVANSINSSFMNFQNKELTLNCNIIADTNSNACILSTIDYAFVDFVAPVMIKLTDSSNASNNGYYLVRKNEFPFTHMYLDRNQNFSTNSTNSSVTLKSHSISECATYNNLLTMLPGVEYKVFGARKNHLKNIKPVSEDYNNRSGFHKSSIYIDESTPIVDDCESKIKIGLLPQRKTPRFDPTTVFWGTAEGTMLRSK